MKLTPRFLARYLKSKSMEDTVDLLTTSVFLGKTVSLPRDREALYATPQKGFLDTSVSSSFQVCV